MATAEELLATYAEEGIEEYLIPDLNSRIISIPATITNLGVESDDDVTTLHFKMPRYYKELDLYNFDIHINYTNARGTGDVYVVNDKALAEAETFTFSWLVDRHAFAYAGNVEFNVCLKKCDSDGVVIKEFNTTTATLPVLKGLETEEAVVDNNPSVFDCVLQRLYAVEAANAIGKNGYYSIVKVVENTEGVVFTIVDQDGTTTATVRHAYTPVRGVDYWTDNDIDVIHEYVEHWAPKTKVINLRPDGWVNNEQTVTVGGMTKDAVVWVAPDPTSADYTEYNECSVRCISQGADTLTFQCEFTPAVTLLCNIVVQFSATTVVKIAATDDGNGNNSVTII